MPSSAGRECFIHDDPAAVTRWCHERATPGSILVTPSASSRRQFLHDAAAKHGVSLGVTAVSRGQLLSKLESMAGLASLPILSPTLERMLVAESAREAQVPLFERTGFEPPAGAIATVAQLFRSLRTNGVTPQQYIEAGGDTRAADAYARFERKRTKLELYDLTDQMVRLAAHGVPAVRLVIEEPAFANRTVFDFLSKAIAASTHCAIGLSDFSAPETTSSTVARLNALDFSAVREHSVQSAPTMHALGGVGTQDEVNLVARHMLALLRGYQLASGTGTSRQACDPRDILGVAPNGTYLTLLQHACAAIDIPIASPQRIAVSEVPLVRALLDAFRAIAIEAEDTPQRGLVLLATPYVGLATHNSDRLRRDFTLRGQGSMRDWWRIAQKTNRRKFGALAAAIPSLAKHLQNSRTPRELAAVLTALAVDYGFVSAGRKSYLDAGNENSVRLDQQGWDATTEAVDELNSALENAGVNALSAADWLRELTATLNEKSVRASGKGTNGIRLTVAGAGLPPAKHVFAVGWKEGLFPRRIREDAFLSDSVKAALNETGAMFQLGEDRAAHDLDKRERIRRAACESLTISWPATDDDGDRQLPSFYLADLGVTGQTVRSVGDTTWTLPLGATRTELLSRATVLARHHAGDSIASEIVAVQSTLAELTAAEKRAFTGELHAQQVIVLPQEVSVELGALAGSMSATQSKTFVHCLYRHFGEKRLALESLGEPGLDALTLGSIAHDVLATSGRQGFSASQLERILAESWRSTLGRAHIEEDVGTSFERQMLFANLAKLVAAEEQWLASGSCLAAHFELAFGLNEAHDAGRDPLSRVEGLRIDLPLGSRISHSTVRGSLDRVDVIDVDGVRYGVAIDYKLGKGENDRKEMDDCADFQFPIYCEALPAFGIQPVGALYYGISSGERHGVIREDFADRFLPVDFAGKVSRLSAEDFSQYMGDRQEVLRQEVARLARGELVVKPRKDDCKYCGLRPVCRIGTFAVGGTNRDE